MMLLFPGQGSQQPGMGKFLHDNFKLAQETFEEASDTLQIDFKKLCFEGSEQDLALTENTQPCLLLVSTATQRVLTSQFGVKPNQAAGHSIGEYAALVAAGVLSFAPALRAVRIRGQAMQSAVPVGQGGMVAVMGLENAQVEKLCEYVVQESQHSPLSPANFNCPGQVVISGSARCIEWLKTQFKVENLFPEARRVKLIPLQVSAPFHCAMMKPAEEKMREVLTSIEFKNADFPIVQNFSAKAHTAGTELRENLIRQVSAPVRWTQSMEFVKTKSSGVTLAFECGTGKVLAGLLKKIDSEAFRVFNTTNLEELENIEKFIKTGALA
jgi:[acyl-carrier-protein] S-malonyltransferase